MHPDRAIRPLAAFPSSPAPVTDFHDIPPFSLSGRRRERAAPKRNRVRRGCQARAGQGAEDVEPRRATSGADRGDDTGDDRQQQRPPPASVTGMVKRLSPSSRSEKMTAYPSRMPIDDPLRGAQQRGDHRLPAHRGPHLGPEGADGPQQPQLTGALVDGQAQRVGDAEDRDQHGERQQPVDEVDELVDLLGLLGDVATSGSAACRSGNPSATVFTAASICGLAHAWRLGAVHGEVVLVGCRWSGTARR